LFIKNKPLHTVAGTAQDLEFFLFKV